MAEKRKRGQNFSLEDKDKLIKLLLRHKETILNKKTDGATNEAKSSAWISITNSFNSNSSTYRNKESLMKMWEKLKSESKKYYALIKNSTSQTGGGPLILKIDPVLEQVCGILGRGCTGVLGIPDCDSESGLENIPKIIFTQNENFEPAAKALKTQSTVEPNFLETQEESFCPLTQQSIIEGIINIDENIAVESKDDDAQEQQTYRPLWSRRRPQIKNNHERSEATATVSNSIQNVYKKKETVEDLKEQLLREELQFKRKLYQLQLEAVTKEVEIKTAVLEQIRGGGFSLSNLFEVVQNEKKY